MHIAQRWIDSDPPKVSAGASLAALKGSGLKLFCFALCALPLVALVAAGISHQLGPNPPETLTRTTGIWALRCLLITLAISPLSWLTGYSWPLRLRRIIALFGFFYACLHAFVYLVFDQYFDWAEIAKDIVKRPYITAGLLSFLMMMPLAMTSSDGMRKAMGRSWQILHKLTYPCAVLAVFHFFWLVKLDVTVPGQYALILLGLFGLRLIRGRRTHTHSGRKPGALPPF